jgi:hypothetical protein
MKNSTATLLCDDGTRQEISPKNGKTFGLEGEAYDLVGTDMIQLIATHDGRVLLVDEDGKRKKKPVNAAATALYIYGAYDPVVGHAIHCRDDQVG